MNALIDAIDQAKGRLEYWQIYYALYFADKSVANALIYLARPSESDFWRYAEARAFHEGWMRGVGFIWRESEAIVNIVWGTDTFEQWRDIP